MAASDLWHFLRQRPLLLLASKGLRTIRRTGIAGLRWRLRMLWNQTHTYKKWIRDCEQPNILDRASLAAEIAGMEHAPLISIVMPVCNVPAKWLQRAINSVLDQHYPYWELCIADDASTAPHVRPLLEAAAQGDPRIQLVFRESRGHICLATHSALSLAEGEFITFLDHDDELSPLALYYVAREINRYPDTDLLYSDEDMIGTDGRRYDPYFKPDWNLELLRAQNYICHMSVYRAALLRGIDAFPPQSQGSQDWDLTLRITERTNAIRHIPHILYHWRTIPGSTARSDRAKEYALHAGRTVVVDHLARCAENAEVELLPFGHLAISHRLPNPVPRLSLVITNQSAGCVSRHLNALLRHTCYPDLEVVIADSCHDDIGAQQQDICVIRRKDDETHAGLLNRAALAASGNILCFLDGSSEARNNDWLAILCAQASRQEVGAVGALQVLPDDSIWHASYLLDPETIVKHPYRGAPIGFTGIRNRAILQQQVSAVSSGCLAIKKSLFEQFGGFHEASGDYLGVDLCLRILAAGYHNIWTPYASLTLHMPNANEAEKQNKLSAETALRYMQTCWQEWLAHDPSGNPNQVVDKGLPAPKG